MPLPGPNRASDAHPGFVTGLAIEASVLRRSTAGHDPQIADRITCAGADAARARRLAEDLLAAGARALVSYGVAGGLDPALGPGDVVLPETVVVPGGKALDADAPWRLRLQPRFRPGLGDARTTSVGARLWLPADSPRS